MPQNPKIVVVGSSNTDMVTRCPAIPSAGETLLGGTFDMLAGGKGANQAVAAARLGGDVAFIARVGTDALGDQAIEGYRADGIDTTFITRDEHEPTGVAAIWVDEATGENRIIVASGANARLSPDDIDQAREVIAAATVLVCQLETPIETVLAALRMARAYNVTTILNPAPACDLPVKIFGLIDYLTPNEIEAGQLCGDMTAEPSVAAQRLLAMGVKNVIVTLGAAGAYFAGPQGKGDVPAPEIETVVDTTAAGDCFTGALAVRIAEGAPVADAVAFAVTAASISVTRPGAQPSLPYRAHVTTHVSGPPSHFVGAFLPQPKEQI